MSTFSIVLCLLSTVLSTTSVVLCVLTIRSLKQVFFVNKKTKEYLMENTKVCSGCGRIMWVADVDHQAISGHDIAYYCKECKNAKL